MATIVIKNRKKKEYSSKMFNELVLFYIFLIQGRIYKYEVEKILNVSERSINRYFFDLVLSGLIQFIPKTVDVSKSDLSYYALYKNRNERIFLNNKHLNIKNNPIGLNSNNQHIARLTRLALIMQDAFKYDEDYENNYDINKLETFYERHNFNLSSKTIKRDIKLVEAVFDYMKEK